MANPTQLVTAQEFDDHVAPSNAFRGVATQVKDAALQWASGVALGFVKKRKVLPLVEWGTDIRHAVARIAAYDLMSKRGFDPQSGSNDNWEQRHDAAMAWLLLVSRGEAELIDCVDSSSTPTVDEAGPLMASDPITNWNYQTRSAGCYRRRGDGLG